MSEAVSLAVETDLEAFEAEHRRWHATVEGRRTSPYGALSVTRLEWLTEIPQRFDGVLGSWHSEPGGIAVLELDEGEAVERDGATLSGTVRLGPLTGIESTTVTRGEIRIEVAARGGSLALRTRDPNSPDRLGYSGTARFPFDPAWVIEARFVPDERSAVQVDSIIPDKPQHYDSPGIAEFEVDGQLLRLILFKGKGPDGLRAIFADPTGEDLTFAAARNVEVTRTGPDALRIDFNRSTNPPCSYSAYATCPLPPVGNRLPVRIQAGELRPGLTVR